jgi:hypothetical protein
LPHVGRIGDGIPGAVTVGGFGRRGTAHEGLYFCESMMNCVIYTVDAVGNAEPYIILDEPAVPTPIMPYCVFYGGPNFGELEGQLLLAGLRGSSFSRDAPHDHLLEYFVIEDDAVRPDPIRRASFGHCMAEVAPPEFGSFGGHTFVVEFGATNQMHVTKAGAGALPYDEQILRIDPEGNVHVFADGLQGGYNELRFDGDRMLISVLRKSFSTGEYHEPDGSIYEIKAL